MRRDEDQGDRDRYADADVPGPQKPSVSAEKPVRPFGLSHTTLYPRNSDRTVRSIEFEDVDRYGAPHKKKLYGTVMGTPILEKHGKDERKDERRAAIVDIAHAAFLADGYAATSMSTIAAKVGGSKATLYNYFSSKEELFVAVVSRKCEHMQSLLYDAQVESGDFRSALQNFGEHFIALVLQEELVATYRMVMAECERFPELGRAFYDTGMKQGRARLAEYFEEAIAGGRPAQLRFRSHGELLLRPLHVRHSHTQALECSKTALLTTEEHSRKRGACDRDLYGGIRCER